jgi:hypothetical protein
MHVSTTHVLRKFAQKMAAQNKQANPMAGIGAALSDPRVLGGAAGALGGGLGAYGLARMTQSDEDKENSNMPMMAGLLGALAGGAGGAYGAPQLAEMLKQRKATADMQANAAKTVNPQPEIANTVDGDRDLNLQHAATFKHQLNRGATEPVVPNAESQDYLDNMASGGSLGPAAFMGGEPNKSHLSAMGLGSR